MDIPFSHQPFNDYYGVYHALAKSTHIERMKENFEIFGFQISDEDMRKISELDTKTSLFFDHQTPEAVDMFVGMIQDRKGKTLV